jgi:hypothetical protein
MDINLNTNSNPDINIENAYRDIIVLYCPEKVGSTSIVSSVRISAADKYIVFHTHDNKIASLTNNIATSVNISDIVLNNNVYNPITNKLRKIYFIDIFRTPIERKISFFFQKISEIHFNNSEENISNYPIDKLFKRFNDIFIHMKETDYFNEYYSKLGSKPIEKFDFNKKYTVIQNDNIYWIKLRLQDSDMWGDILSEILGIKIHLISDYNTSGKNIGLMYKRFKDEYKIPYNYYKLIEQCDLLSIYMEADEKNKYLLKWKEKTCSIHIPFTNIEYKFYQKISEENRFYCANSSNIHYADDGCFCSNCSTQRKNIIQNISNNIRQSVYIRHPYDNLYKNHAFLKLFSVDPNNPIETVINLINL